MLGEICTVIVVLAILCAIFENWNNP